MPTSRETSAASGGRLPDDEPALPVRSREEADVGWGDHPELDDHERLLRDRPPHWGSM